MPCNFKTSLNLFAFLYVMASYSKEMSEQISFPTVFRKSVVSIFVENKGYLSLKNAPAKNYFFRMVLTWHKKLSIQEVLSIRCQV